MLFKRNSPLYLRTPACVHTHEVLRSSRERLEYNPWLFTEMLLCHMMLPCIDTGISNALVPLLYQGHNAIEARLSPHHVDHLQYIWLHLLHLEATGRACTDSVQICIRPADITCPKTLVYSQDTMTQTPSTLSHPAGSPYKSSS